MAVECTGFASCDHCGAQFRLLTIFNKDMTGFVKVWKRRHEKICAQRTPEQRRKWAQQYAGKDQYESSIVVDLSHPGFGGPASSIGGSGS